MFPPKEAIIRTELSSPQVDSWCDLTDYFKTLVGGLADIWTQSMHMYT